MGKIGCFCIFNKTSLSGKGQLLVYRRPRDHMGFTEIATDSYVGTVYSGKGESEYINNSGYLVLLLYKAFVHIFIKPTSI